MRQVRAFVQHSMTAISGDSEGTPVGILEAGGAGLPVISTYHAGIPDVVEDGITGYLVNEGDIELMADRMIAVAQDSALAARMGVAAQAKVLSNYTLEKSISRLITIIETAVKQEKTNA